MRRCPQHQLLWFIVPNDLLAQSCWRECPVFVFPWTLKGARGNSKGVGAGKVRKSAEQGLSCRRPVMSSMQFWENTQTLLRGRIPLETPSQEPFIICMWNSDMVQTVRDYCMLVTSTFSSSRSTADISDTWKVLYFFSMFVFFLSLYSST